MSYQNNVEQTIGAPPFSPQFASQCVEIREIINQLRERLIFVSVRNLGEKAEKLRSGHINEELEDIKIQLKDLLGSIQY